MPCAGPRLWLDCLENFTLKNQKALFEIAMFLCETPPRSLHSALKLQPQP
jgi:hypothetical protein